MKKKLNIGIIGTGIGLKHLEAYKFSELCEVKCIYEKNIKKYNFLRKKFNSILFVKSEKEFFEKFNYDIVSIASYDQYHFAQIKECAKRHINIVVEKPMCLKITELKKIKTYLKKYKIKMISNLVLRENSLFKKIKKKYENKKIFYIEADYLWGRQKKLYGWRSSLTEYSLTLGATIHILDLVIWILNKKPNYVYAIGTKKMTKNSKFKKHSLITYFFKFPGDIIAKLSANAVCSHPHFHELKIFLKNETFISNLFGQGFITKLNNKHQINKTKYKYPDKKNRKMLIVNFVKAIYENSFNTKNMNYQFDLLSACFAADKSLTSKKEIKIEY